MEKFHNLPKVLRIDINLSLFPENTKYNGHVLQLSLSASLFPQ